MNRRWHFAGSEVASIDVVGPRVTVRFASAEVEEVAEGAFGGWRSGHLAGVRLSGTAAGAWPAPDGACVGLLATGRLATADATRAVLPFPFATGGPVRLALDFANGALWAAALVDVRLDAPDGQPLADRFAC